MKVEIIKIPYSKDNVKKLSEFLEPRFEVLKWEWAAFGVPKKKDIEEVFYLLIEGLDKVDYSATGGLFVDRDKVGKLFTGVDKKFNKVISKEELESIFKKKSRRMLRFI